MKQIINIINEMKNSEISNYILPGLSSSMIGGKKHGCVRLFENQRCQQGAITPHSHRFDFTCLVLDGHVTNRKWAETDEANGDFFEMHELEYLGKTGEYKKNKVERSWWSFYDKKYGVGDIYSMEHTEIHSIIFSRNAKVLFFEGPNISNKSVVIEPVVYGEQIPVMKTESWMFKKIPD